MSNENLSIKEKSFVYELTRIDSGRPKTKIEAFERSYSTGGTRQTRQNEVTKVLARPRIKAAIAEAEARIEADRRRSSRGTAAAIQAALWELASNADRESDRINALGKLITLLPKNAVEDEFNPKDSVSSKTDLVERLQNILEDNLTAMIDVTPSDEDETVEADIIDAVAVLPPAIYEDDEPEY